MSTHNHNEELGIVVARIDENVTTLVKRQDDHEERIRGLEKWRWKGAGALGLITIAIAAYEAFHR